MSWREIKYEPEGSQEPEVRAVADPRTRNVETAKKTGILAHFGPVLGLLVAAGLLIPEFREPRFTVKWIPDIGKSESEPARTPTGKPSLRSESTEPMLNKIGEKIFVVSSKTSSFEDLVDQAASTGADPGAIALVERHFNKYYGKGSGFYIFCNPLGAKVARAFNDEYRKIYDEQGWKYDKPVAIIPTTRYHLLKVAQKKGMPCIMGEFGFVDDRVNGDKIGNFLKSKAGQERIARASIAATRSLNMEAFVFAAGHHGVKPNGTTGAYFGEFHETDYAFATFAAMDDLLEKEKSGEIDLIAARKPAEPAPKTEPKPTPKPQSRSRIS